MKSHRFSSSPSTIKHAFRKLKSRFVTFYNEVYSGDAEQYVEGLPDSKRRALSAEINGILALMKRLDKTIRDLK